ncbi:MAG: sigma-70 family RNA polymerase sigma factor [Cyclobacteriaceae bacterium]|nr:sigma-70 family RNA polymerase sigma factor [Cyclobacteriaceae bacterium]
MNQAQAITLYQPMLHSIAYNLLRCKADAEDIVQDTFVKWLSIDTTKIQNTKAYLIKAVTNNCLNHLNALKRKKEEYWDSIMLSELVVKFKESDFANIDFEKELADAFKVIQSKLEPLERATYLLKEVFDFDYESIQKIIDKKTDHCRQLFSRAKKKLSEASPKLKFETNDASGLFESFKKACTVDNATELIGQLKKDIAESLSKKKPEILLGFCHKTGSRLSYS